MKIDPASAVLPRRMANAASIIAVGADGGAPIDETQGARATSKLEPIWEHGAFVVVLATTNEVALGVEGAEVVKA